MTPSRHECQDCGWTGSENDLQPVKYLEQRVDVGEPTPSGECPECGALCHPIDEENEE